jgi:transposase-like protein
MSAKQIIQDVCDEFGVTVERLTNGRTRKGVVSLARYAAINRMWLEDFSIRQISRFLKVNYATVQYHLYPKRRETVRRSKRAWLERQRMAA